ncbi:MAG: hypothetical protein U9N77_08440, partial [Thermodesulfobacteriota bacterium]|nr:hypothetical protein [Thermodesulfobacteriota bacterium]
EKSDNKMKILTKGGIKTVEKNMHPAYAWFNGKHHRYIKGDTVELKGVVNFNIPDGDISDPSAKITPYKILRTNQAADAEYKYLIAPHLIGKDGLFKTRDIQKSSTIGMKAAGLKFSGKVTFVETRMYWRINHGVVPKNEALSCLNCHSPSSVMDFKALGYKGDPAKVGSRFTK